MQSIHQSDLKKILKNINNKKRNILFLVHNDFIQGIKHPVAGTEYHVKDLVKYLDENAFILFNNNKYLYLQCIRSNKKEELIQFCFETVNITDIDIMNNLKYKELLKILIQDFDIDLIHVHHFINNTFDIIDIAKELNIPIYFTIHDYYLACPKVNFLDLNNIYCKNTRNETMCKNCLKKSIGYEYTFLQEWNQKIYSYLNKFDKIFAPSYSTKSIFENYYKEIYEEINFNITVIEHGIEIPLLAQRKQTDLNKENIFRIAFIGGIGKNKGVNLIKKVIKDTKQKNIEWHIFGKIHDSDLKKMNMPRLIKHGAYKREAISQLLDQNKINLVCILSSCPETYCYSLMEALISGIPVIVTKIGALEERVAKNRCGWMLENDSKEELLSLIERISKKPKEYDDKLNAIKTIKFKTTREMVEEYVSIYNENDFCNKRHKEKSIRILPEKILVCNLGELNTDLFNSPKSLGNVLEQFIEVRDYMIKLYKEFGIGFITRKVFLKNILKKMLGI